jgi:HEAT repeat protein
MLDQAFDALKSYDWGVDPKTLAPIDDAVRSTRDDAAARLELENRLAAVLATEASRDAKDYVCRKLMAVGTAACVPTLAAKLADEELSHMARYALERIQAPEAAQALRDALPKLNGPLKIGVMSSLGSRGDRESAPALASLLEVVDASIVRAAAIALGDIGGAEAVAALSSAEGAEATSAIVDARLICAERLLKDGHKAEALAIYKPLVANELPKHVRLAATRGLLACAGKKQ